MGKCFGEVELEKSVGEKCSREVLVVKECCKEVLWRSVVEKCCRRVL